MTQPTYPFDNYIINYFKEIVKKKIFRLLARIKYIWEYYSHIYFGGMATPLKFWRIFSLSSTKIAFIEFFKFLL